MDIRDELDRAHVMGASRPDSVSLYSKARDEIDRLRRPHYVLDLDEIYAEAMNGKHIMQGLAEVAEFGEDAFGDAVLAFTRTHDRLRAHADTLNASVARERGLNLEAIFIIEALGGGVDELPGWRDAKRAWENEIWNAALTEVRKLMGDQASPMLLDTIDGIAK